MSGWHVSGLVVARLVLPLALARLVLPLGLARLVLPLGLARLILGLDRHRFPPILLQHIHDVSLPLATTTHHNKTSVKSK